MRKTGAEGVNVRLPRFELESMPRLGHVLRNNLGVRGLFSSGEADLSGMFLESPLSGSVHVDDFLHKVILKVDEKGSVATAASATVVERVGSFGGPYFEADHPFLFFLTDKQSGLILFAGVYAGPNRRAGSGTSSLPSF
jgi:serpin B